MLCHFNGCERNAWCKSYCRNHYYYAHRHGLLPRPECLVEGCEKPSFRGGMCNAHHLRLKRYGDPHFRKKVANGEASGAACSIEGCGRTVRGKGLCQVHYGRQRHQGDPLAVPRKLGNGQATPERRRENTARAMRKYSQTPHGKLRSRYSVAKRRVLQGLETSGIPKAAFLELWASTACGICSKAVVDDDKSIDHVIPLSRGGTNDIGNMQIAHLRCNQRKSNKIY